ncbi:MAG: hypothetical protein OXU36_02475 [Candidatus Poribacteria bacterium]|nr:hypothetical protein [Candidatus Poribacteria bacterium]
MQTLLSTGSTRQQTALKNLLVLATGLYALVVFTLIGCGTAEEDPLESSAPEQTRNSINPTQMSAIPAAPPAPTDGTPFVKEVGYYRDWKLTQPLTGTIPPSTTLYTKVVFSEPMQHLPATDNTARPILYYRINQQRTRYRIAAHGARGEDFVSGAAKPRGTSTQTFICKYTVHPDDTGTFRLEVGKRSADRQGNPLAAFYVHSSTLQLGQPAVRREEDIHLSNNTIDENNAPNAVIGIFETEAGAQLSYKIIKGPKRLFAINAANELIARRTFNYEVGRPRYEIRVREKDVSTGKTLTKDFTIFVNDLNEAPTDLELSSYTFPAGAVRGTFIAGIRVKDEDVRDTHRFQLIEGGEYLEVEGNRLQVRESFPMGLEQVSILLEVVDKGNVSYREGWTLMRETPPPSEPEDDTANDTDTDSTDDTDAQEISPPSEPDPPRKPPGGGNDGRLPQGDDDQLPQGEFNQVPDGDPFGGGDDYL